MQLNIKIIIYKYKFKFEVAPKQKTCFRHSFVDAKRSAMQRNRMQGSGYPKNAVQKKSKTQHPSDACFHQLEIPQTECVRCDVPSLPQKDFIDCKITPCGNIGQGLCVRLSSVNVGNLFGANKTIEIIILNRLTVLQMMHPFKYCWLSLGLHYI